jgi:eukaryotic-like serine/threonine-protein kinase
VNFNSRAFLGVSENGTIIYDESTESEDRRQLTWFDRTGKQIETIGQAGPIFRFKLSPDERFVSITRRSMDSARADVFVSDITRGASSRLSSAPGNDTPETIWSPDGKFVVWNEIADGKFQLVRKLANGAGEVEVLVDSPVRVFPLDWSPDGKHILYAATDNATSNDLWVLPLEGERKPSLYFRTPGDERFAVFSPDGKYVAYSSQESGRNEVYVQTFPASTEKWPISTNGGQSPRWPRKGTELFYSTIDGKIMSVALKRGATLEAGVPQALFDMALARPARSVDYAVSTDGQRFLFISRDADAATTPLVVILNWSAGLNK